MKGRGGCFGMKYTHTHIYIYVCIYIRETMRKIEVLRQKSKADLVDDLFLLYVSKRVRNKRTKKKIKKKMSVRGSRRNLWYTMTRKRLTSAC